jgi:hypothetical protein
MGYFKCKSVRLCRYLYSLGFEKKSIFENNVESWLFKKSDRLQQALDFFFYMRKTGANENEIQCRDCEKRIT